MPRHANCCNVCSFFCVVVSLVFDHHTRDAYVTMSPITVMYHQCTIFGLKLHVLPKNFWHDQKQPVALTRVLSTWVFYWSLLPKVTSKYFTSLKNCIDNPSSCKSLKFGFLRLVNGTMIIFLRLTQRSFLSHHLLIMCRAFCIRLEMTHFY